MASVSSSVPSTPPQPFKLNARLTTLMDSIFAIAYGLTVRFVVDSVSRHDLKRTGMLVGLWEGVIMLHFLNKMPKSNDPYIAYAVRLFVDFLFTESIPRLVLVLIWTALGMVLADITPAVWSDVGMARIWRRFKRDMSKMVPTVAFFPPTRTVRFSPSRDSARPTRLHSATALGEEPAPAPAQPSASVSVSVSPSSVSPIELIRRLGRHVRVPGYFPDFFSDIGSDRSRSQLDLDPSEVLEEERDAAPARTSRRRSVYPEFVEEDEGEEGQQEEDNISYTASSSTSTERGADVDADADALPVDPNLIPDMDPNDDLLIDHTAAPAQQQDEEEEEGEEGELHEEGSLTPRGHPYIPMPPTPSDSAQHARPKDEEPIPPPHMLPSIPDEDWVNVPRVPEEGQDDEEEEEGGEKPPPLPAKDRPKPSLLAPEMRRAGSSTLPTPLSPFPKGASQAHNKPDTKTKPPSPDEEWDKLDRDLHADDNNVNTTNDQHDTYTKSNDNTTTAQPSSARLGTDNPFNLVDLDPSPPLPHPQSTSSRPPPTSSGYYTSRDGSGPAFPSSMTESWTTVAKGPPAPASHSQHGTAKGKGKERESQSPPPPPPLDPSLIKARQVTELRDSEAMVAKIALDIKRSEERKKRLKMGDLGFGLAGESNNVMDKGKGKERESQSPPPPPLDPSLIKAKQAAELRDSEAMVAKIALDIKRSEERKKMLKMGGDSNRSSAESEMEAKEKELAKEREKEAKEKEKAERKMKEEVDEAARKKRRAEEEAREMKRLNDEAMRKEAEEDAAAEQTRKEAEAAAIALAAAEQKRKDDEAAERKRKEDDEAAEQKRKAEEEEKKKKEEEAAERKRDAEAAQARREAKQLEEENKKKEDEDRKVKAEEDRRKKEEDDRRRDEEEDRRKKKEDRKKKKDEEDRQKKEEEERKQKEEDDRRREEEEDRRKKKEDKKKKKDEEDRQKKEEEDRKQKVEDDRRKKEEDDRRRDEEEDRRKKKEDKKKKKEEEDRQKKEEEDRKQKEEEDRRAEEEDRQKKDQEDAQREADEKARQQKEEKEKELQRIPADLDASKNLATASSSSHQPVNPRSEGDQTPVENKAPNDDEHLTEPQLIPNSENDAEEVEEDPNGEWLNNDNGDEDVHIADVEDDDKEPDEQIQEPEESVASIASSAPEDVRKRLEKTMLLKAQMISIESYIEERNAAIPTLEDDNEKAAAEADLENNERALRKMLRKEKRRFGEVPVPKFLNGKYAKNDTPDKIMFDTNIGFKDVETKIEEKLESIMTPDAKSMKFTMQAATGRPGTKQMENIKSIMTKYNLWPYMSHDKTNQKIMDINISENDFAEWLTTYYQAVTHVDQDNDLWS